MVYANLLILYLGLNLWNKGRISLLGNWEEEVPGEAADTCHDYEVHVALAC